MKIELKNKTTQNLISIYITVLYLAFRVNLLHTPIKQNPSKNISRPLIDYGMLFKTPALINAGLSSTKVKFCKFIF